MSCCLLELEETPMEQEGGRGHVQRDPVSHHSLAQVWLSTSPFLVQGGTAGICRVCKFGSSPLNKCLGQF